ncbi:PREDICTED: pectinesterase 3-like [Camelina sativa]|uniref:Pectinesterase 3-like n=1 Tax=Camelina sativa TaxID=90675 RepID=A0ABM0YMU6_CAMSA|nr:PREDICTED: pectinesterase 3-like [Camelina sativa]XP_010503372.1 PREDICTED: pectinesterase 3-like [Camelina sativa]
MESINTMKGYGKVSDQENQVHHHSPLPKPSSSSYRKTLIATVSVVSLLLILAVVALTAGAFTHSPSPSPPHHPPISSASLKTVCAVTRYPETCFDSLSSSLNESDSKLSPESILELSLRAASKEVSRLSVSFRSINDMPEDAAVGDCVKLYTDALSQINESVSEIGKEKNKGGTWLTKEVVGDVKTWISAAMTDGETCSDGIEEMGTVVGNEIKKEMEMANQMMSISLAIVSQMKKLLVILH